MRRKPSEISESDALNRMAAYCSASEHCFSEIEEKLRKLGIAEDAITRILHRLEEEKLIDETRYCRAFVNDKLRFSGWGKRKMAQSLQMKRISRAVYQPIIDAIDPKEYEKALRQALEQKESSLKPTDVGYQRQMKLYRFGMSRGYSFDELRKFIDITPVEDALIDDMDV